jgi:hypothetical protein
MRSTLRQMVIVALLSLASAASANADGGVANGLRGSPHGPIFDITHVDVIPATINGLDFQQTAYAAMFAYRDASRHDQGLESFRIVNWILAANHAQIVDVWDSIETLNRHLARHHSVNFRFAVQNVSPPPPAPFDCCEIVAKARGRFGVIDILVNNAGIGQAIHGIHSTTLLPADLA